MIKLDCNEAYYDLSTSQKRRALELMLQTNWTRYPSIDAAPVRGRLSKKYGLPAEQIYVGNGSDEMLQAVFIGLGPLYDSVVTPIPTFGMYRVLATRFGKRLVEVMSQGAEFSPNIEGLLSHAQDTRALLILCQPNNPTGRAFTQSELNELIEKWQGIIVIDQAYAEFCQPEPLAAPREHCMVILRTLSKAYGAAALRIGYALASVDLAPYLKEGLLPYNLNALSQALALLYLDIETHRHVLLTIAERNYLYEALKCCKNISPIPSQSNFLLFRVDSAQRIWNKLRSRGILIRRFNEEYLLQYLRVTIGSPEENQQFLRALIEIMEEVS